MAAAKLLRVLHVEDSPRDALLLQRHLSHSGYDLVFDRVETASAMKTALEAQAWDVILADYSMPEFGAIQALATLHATGLDIPFIIISGTIGEELAVEAMLAGASDYLMKGKLARLGPAIERELEEARGRKARRQAEEEMVRLIAEGQRQQERLNAIIASVPGVVWEAWGQPDIATQRTDFVSDYVETLLGYTPAEWLARPNFWLSIVHPDDRDRAGRQAAASFIANRRGTQSFRWVAKDGSIRWVESNYIVISDDDGKPVGMRGVTIDVTDRKALEEQFRQAQKMEAVGQLAGGIAHDFNNLLTVINGYSELAMLQLGSEDPLRQNMEQIAVAGNRAAALTRQLLAFSRKQVLLPVVLDLKSLLTDLEKMLHRLIGEDIALRTDFALDTGHIKADRGQVEQIVMNLVVNARDAMASGGKLTIETQNVELTEAYAGRHVGVHPGRYVMLAVSDTGSGMDAQTQSRIFEPFFTTKEAGKGTGLGLSTVYGIVQQSGGSIWVYSEPGLGTTFKVYLPQVGQDSRRVELQNKVSGDALRGTETILLTEDDEMVRALARAVLSSHGYRVLEAESGDAAIALCGRHREAIHLLITDLVMPGMSGRDLVDRLEKIRPEIKVLYMSGYTDKAVVHQHVLDEKTPFIQKPFAPQALLKKIREVLGPR